MRTNRNTPFFFKMNSLDQQFDNILKEKKPINLYEPISYILHQSGKKLRPQLVKTASNLFDGDPVQVKHIMAAFEMLHNFTLIHDDIMDKADIRRSEPTVYKKWNTNIAILSGDALAVLAFQQLLKLDCDLEIQRQLSEIFTQTALEICEGQQFDLDFETAENVTIAEYINMIRLKTAVMFAGCLKSGALFAGADKNSLDALYNLGIHLGIAFQLADDLLDVYADVDVFGKAVGGDIKDNKKTFLYLKALEVADDTQKSELKKLYSSTQITDNEKYTAVKNIYDALNIKEITETEIKRYTQMCLEDISKIDSTEEKKAFLLSLVKKLQKRDK